MKQAANSLAMYSRGLLRSLFIAFIIVLFIGIIGSTVIHTGYFVQARPPVSWCPACGS